MGRVLRRYFEDLFVGDPVALIATGIFLLFLVGLLLLGIKIMRDKRRRDKEFEEKRRRRGY
jgi:hypothetical protein